VDQDPPSRGALNDADMFVIDGAAWRANGEKIDGYDLNTGKLVGRIETDTVYSEGHPPRCYRAKVGVALRLIGDVMKKEKKIADEEG